MQENRENPTVQLYVCEHNELNKEHNFGNINYGIVPVYEKHLCLWKV